MSKVIRPILTEIFARSRLFSLLDQMREHPVIWVSGPAGCGKTSLVSSYLEARKIPCLWYEVDEGDADLATFFYYLGQAAKRAAPRKRSPLTLLTPEYLQGIPTFTKRFFEKLYERLQIPSVVVFDNYQEVSADSPFHDAILSGLSNLPPRVNAILISRIDPIPSFIRIRANHLMEILTWKDLCLTIEESAGIVRLRSKQKLSKEAIAGLHKAAGGWAAGLVLILEMAKIEDVEPQKAGKARPQEIFDYFASEIFDRTEKEVQEFLLKTSLLPKMTTRMAEELSGLSSASRLLSMLSQNNYFTEKRIHSEPIYQYHPLFREFLLSRIKDTFPQERVIPLCHQAASLLEGDGQIEATVTILHEIGDTEGIASLIMNHAPCMAAQGRYQALESWLRFLPEDAMEKYPLLLYWKGVSRFPFEASQALPFFEKAFEGLRVQNNLPGSLLAWSGAIDSIFYDFKNLSLMDRWIQIFPGLPENPESSLPQEVWSRVVTSMFSALSNRHPDHPEINTWEERALSLAQGPGSPLNRAIILFHLAHWYMIIGDHGKAALARQLLQHLAKPKESLPLVILLARMEEAFQFQMAGKHEKCLRAVSEGLKTSEHSGIYSQYSHLMGHAIMSCQNMGDLDTAQSWIEKMGSSLERLSLMDIGLYHFCQVRQALLRSDLGAAISHVEWGLQAELKSGFYGGLSLGYLISAQVMHRIGKQEEAWSHLHKTFHFAERFKSRLLEYYGLMIEAYFYFEQGDEISGLASLRKALAIGKGSGIFMTYVDQPAVTASLCVKALEENVEVPYVQHLIRNRRLIPESPPLHLENWPWNLKVFTLGRFELLKEDKPIPSSRKIQQKPLMMLKVMIALGGKGVKEEQLSDILWAEADGDDAHNSFITTQHRLRQLIGYENAIQHKEGQLTLDDRQCWVDVWAFEWLLGQAEAEKKRGAAENAVQCIEKAIHLYKGPFLADEIDQSWIISTRERCRSRFIRSLTWLGHYWQDQEEWEKAIVSYQRGLEIDDVAEDLYQQLMICFRELGRQAEALSVYQRCRKALSGILGIAPSPKTEAIFRSLSSRGKI
jgi:LuxR family transcriptional regulator, maltose regulon positive regulatory protein